MPQSPQLRLESVVARAVTVPLRRPVVAAIGRFDKWPLVLIDVRTADGIVGHAYISPYRSSAVPSVLAELNDLSEQLKGTVIAPMDAFDGGMHKVDVVGKSGIARIAASGLDMALWDALAKSAGLPLAVLLGGSIGPVRAYNSNGLWRHDPSTLGDEAAELITEGGFRALKLRLGYEHVRDDLAAISAVRSAIGDRIDLMVDFNQALGFGDAVRRCHDLDDEGLYWFEEPLDYSDVRGYGELARRVRTPLQMGENHYGDRDLFTFLAAGAVHYAMGDLMRIGGVTGWLRTAGLAGASGIQYSNHLYPEISAHLLRVTPTAHWLEWVDWASPILQTPTKPENGQLTARDVPGIGIEWDEDAVRHYAWDL
jgi:mandelate racemase